MISNWGRSRKRVVVHALMPGMKRIALCGSSSSATVLDGAKYPDHITCKLCRRKLARLPSPFYAEPGEGASPRPGMKVSAPRRGSSDSSQVPAAPARVWVAELPDVFGYGCVGYGATEREAMEACERAYQVLRKSYGTSTPFDHNWEQFAGHCAEVTLGKGYVHGNIGRDHKGDDLGH